MAVLETQLVVTVRPSRARVPEYRRAVEGTPGFGWLLAGVLPVVSLVLAGGAWWSALAVLVVTTMAVVGGLLVSTWRRTVAGRTFDVEVAM